MFGLPLRTAAYDRANALGTSIADGRASPAKRPSDRLPPLIQAGGRSANPPGGKRAGGDPPTPASPLRPLWLLPEPLTLTGATACALLHEPLQLRHGPERIESGWWNGDAVRDYFIATDARGERLWVYRERPGENWYLHGLFG